MEKKQSAISVQQSALEELRARDLRRENITPLEGCILVADSEGFDAHATQGAAQYAALTERVAALTKALAEAKADMEACVEDNNHQGAIDVAIATLHPTPTPSPRQTP